MKTLRTALIMNTDPGGIFCLKEGVPPVERFGSLTENRREREERLWIGCNRCPGCTICPGR